MRLWLACADDDPVAGVIVLTAGRTAVYWHGAAVPERGPGAANLLHWEAIGRLAAEGRALYDLNPSGGHPGVERFKRTLGAAPAPAPLLTTEGLRGRVIDRMPTRRRDRSARER